jgi:hypothetical protein
MSPHRFSFSAAEPGAARVWHLQSLQILHRKAAKVAKERKGTQRNAKERKGKNRIFSITHIPLRHFATFARSASSAEPALR